MLAMPEQPRSAPPRLEHLLDASTDGMLSLDLLGRPTWLNTSAERMLGLPRRELLGRGVWTRDSPLEGTALARACRHAAEEGVPATVEEHLAHLGAWVEARVFPSLEGLLVQLRDVTPFKQVEADADRLHALVLSAPVAAFITRGPQHVFELNNPRHRQLHGGRELLGLSAREPLLELEGGGVLALLDRAYATGQALVLDAVPLHLPQPGGGREERLFHLTCEPLRDAAGQVEGLAVFTFEVTELVRARRKAEQLAEDLRRNEERFRSLVVSTSTILWVTDPSGHTQADSPSWCAFTGQSNAKWRDGSGWLEAIHPEDRALASAAWKRAFETRGLYEVEYRLRRADGMYLPVVSRGVPVLEPDGSVREWVGAISDITPQRRARQALELLSETSAALTSSLELRLAMERLARCVVPRFAEWCAIYVLGPEGRAERVACVDHQPTRAIRLRMEGVSLEDSPHDPRRVLEQGEVEHFPPLSEQLLYGQELNPDRRVLRFAFAGLRGMTLPLILEGQVLGAITFAVGKDYRDYDAEDQRVAGELAHRAAVAVEHARLFALARAERDRAEESNRAKDEFLATLSHELRTPLTSILGWTQMLLSGRIAPERVRRALESVERGARAQHQLVENLLDTSRVIAGELHLELQPVELAPVAEAALDEVRPAAATQGMQLEAALEAGVGPLRGDPARLRQVVRSLLTNALKFTGPGGRVTLRLRRVEGHAELEVADTGQGIPPAFLTHVFERFRQADGSVTRKHGGLGLGLALVRHLVELHGGTIQAHSEGDGRGARFTVRLPLAPGALQAPAEVR